MALRHRGEHARLRRVAHRGLITLSSVERTVLAGAEWTVLAGAERTVLAGAEWTVLAGAERTT